MTAKQLKKNPFMRISVDQITDQLVERLI